MVAAAGIWNQETTRGKELGGHASPLAGPGSGGGGGGNTNSNNSASISANDFLTLLVTEMQNQDPTAQTDPNEYINQLVAVNSLEQLISINQNLSTALGTSNTASAPTSGQETAGAASAHAQTGAQLAAAPEKTGDRLAEGLSGAASLLGPHAAGATQGNLGIPAPTSASERVARSLGGEARPHSIHRRP
ncbi:MAG: flagellar hook capping FlgD N-terminal domain-containing protein [Terracidiphilus sp.]